MSFPSPGRKRSPHSALSTPTPNNHTLTRTGTPNTPNSRLQHQHQHLNLYSHSSMTLSDRLNMSLPPSPPAEQAPSSFSSSLKASSPGSGHAPVQSAVKLGAGAPSFASVVSATSTTPARSPLPSPSNQQLQIQIQEHAQSSSLLSPDYNSTSNNINAHTHSRSSSLAGSFISQTSSSRYHSPLASPGGSARPNEVGNLSQEPEPTDAVTNSADDDLDAENTSGSSSSDVEIYLHSHTLGLHDSAARMHVFNKGTRDLDANANLNPFSSNSANTHVNSTSNSNAPFPPPDSLNEVLGGTQDRVGNTDANLVTTLGPHVINSPSTDSHDAKSLSSSCSPLPESQFHQHDYYQQRQHDQHESEPQQKGPRPSQAHVHSTGSFSEVDHFEYQFSEQQHSSQQRQPYASIHGKGHSEFQVQPSIDLSGLSIHDPLHSQYELSDSLAIPSSQSHNLPLNSSHTHLSGGFNSSLSPTSLAFPNSPSGPTAAFPESASDSALGGVPGQKTPNVYINGLPPHFPEDQLFALASPFGDIRSVRTFTRHVRDSESGYGFVLFETIDAAERCIISLRRYRNLHPTFSKQVHKIPGTTYAQSGVPHSSSSASWDEGHSSLGHGESGSPDEHEDGNSTLDTEASFKAKMESLQDPMSTNLYMEGLPLSIDEPTLSALVSPHRISSSRFFQTRLSNPPRIIAFVRLETRIGAEEIIERLHGRMVRGWNDTGSRISVRFADTSEQRELRRQERAAQEGDGSPARLTIAQAALLNLRGQQLRPTANSGPVIHAHPNPGRRIPSSSLSRGGFSTSFSAPDFSSNAHMGGSGSPIPLIGSTGGGNMGGAALEVDYSLAPGRGGTGSRARSPYQASYSLGHTPPPPMMSALPPSTSRGVDPAMNALLDSLRSTGVPFQPGGAGGYGNPTGEVQPGMGLGHYGHGPAHGYQHHHNLPVAHSMDNLQQYARPAPAYTRSGYTATEEYIMRAHAESAALAHAQVQQQHHQQQQLQASGVANADRRHPAPLDLRRRGLGEDHDAHDDTGAANIAVGVRAYRAQASLGRLGQGLMTSSSSASLGSLRSSSSVGSPLMGMNGGASAAMNEDDLHVPSNAVRSEFRHQLRSLGAGEEGNHHMGTTTHARTRPNPNLHPPHVNARLSRDPSSQSSYHVQRPPMPLSPSLASVSNLEPSSMSNTEDVIMYQHAAAHMRSTTLPQHRSSSARDGQSQIHGRGHYQHSSMSLPAQNLKTPQHAGVAVLSGPSGIEGRSGTIYENDAQDQQQQEQGEELQNANGNGQSNTKNFNTQSNSNASKNHYQGSSVSPIFGDLDSSSPSPSLISPTLTYSSQTPSTLSPATPFFGSFNSQTEGFSDKGLAVGLDQQQKKQASTNMSRTSLSSLSR